MGTNDHLIKHKIPVDDCDLVVYYKLGNRTKNKLFYYGACGRSQKWNNQYDAFKEYELYLVKKRGQRESPMKSGLPDLQGAIDDVHDIMCPFNMEKATLVGHSWGGNPLQEYTYQFPEKVNGLAIIGSWGQHRIVTDKEKKMLKYFKFMYKIVSWFMVANSNSKVCSKNPRTVDWIKKSILEAGRDVL